MVYQAPAGAWRLFGMRWPAGYMSPQASCPVRSVLLLFFLLLSLTFILHNLVLPAIRQPVDVVDDAVVHMYGYYFFHNSSISNECGCNVALAACCLWLATSGDREAWSLQLFSVDHDPGAMLLPAVAHDLQLQRNGCQLRWRCLTNFYCEFFHSFFSDSSAILF